MFHHKVCSYCQSQFEAVRSDANYCSALCRTKASQHRRNTMDFEKDRNNQIQQLKQQIEKLKQDQAVNIQGQRVVQQKVEQIKNQIIKCDTVLNLDKLSLIKTYQKQYLPKIDKDESPAHAQITK